MGTATIRLRWQRRRLESRSRSGRLDARAQAKLLAVRWELMARRRRIDRSAV